MLFLSALIKTITQSLELKKYGTRKDVKNAGQKAQDSKDTQQGLQVS
jgi:hypothetical protein